MRFTRMVLLILISYTVNILCYELYGCVLLRVGCGLLCMVLCMVLFNLAPYTLMRYTLWVLRMRFTTHRMRFTTHGSTGSTHGSLYSSILYTDALYVTGPSLSQSTISLRDIPFPVQQQQHVCSVLIKQANEPRVRDNEPVIAYSRWKLTSPLLQ